MTIRKWLTLLESENTEEPKTIQEIYNEHFFGDAYVIDSDTGLVNVGCSVLCIGGRWKLPKLPVKFGTVEGDFQCENRGLTTLENAPTSVNGNFYCYANNFTTLKHLPLGDIWCLDISNCPNLQSLEGIEPNSKINKIELDWVPNLPLLRLLIAKVRVDFMNDLNENAVEVTKIMNHHIKTYSNLKERIIKCQYALIKAGFKGNAKW